MRYALLYTRYAAPWRAADVDARLRHDDITRRHYHSHACRLRAATLGCLIR